MLKVEVILGGRLKSLSMTQQTQESAPFTCYWHFALDSGGVLTVAAVGSGEQTDPTITAGAGAYCWLGASWCSPKDEYNRRKGNLIARGRARCSRTQVLVDLSTTLTPTGRTARWAVYKSVMDLCNVPRWAVTAHRERPVSYRAAVGA